MQASDSLFKLIKGLSKNEKGYFRKLATAFNAEKQSSYLLLFDAIDKQEVYDESVLLKKFRNESFVKQFSVTKGLLFDNILKALRQYHSGNMFIAMNNHIENAQILFKMLLNEEAMDELMRAKKLADIAERPLKQLEIIAIERRAHYENAASDWDELIKSGIEKEEETLDWLLKETHISYIYYRLQKFIRHERSVRTPDHDKYLDDLIASEYLQVDYDRLNFEAKVRFNMIFKIYYQLKNKDHQSLEYMRKVLQEYESRPAVIAAEPKRYLLAINNYLTICSKMALVTEMANCLQSVDEKLFSSDQSAQVFWFDLKVNYQITIFLHLHQWNELKQLLLEIVPLLKVYESKMNSVRLLVTRFNCLIHFLILGMPDQSLEIINDVLNTKGIELRKDLHALARIYNLIVHFELNNTLLMESVARSAKNFLQSREMYFELERVIVRNYMKLINCSSKSEQIEVFKTLLCEVDDTIEKNPLEKNLLQTLDIHGWAQSHIEGLTMKEYTEKYLGVNNL